MTLPEENFTDEMDLCSVVALLLRRQIKGPSNFIFRRREHSPHQVQDIGLGVLCVHVRGVCEHGAHVALEHLPRLEDAEAVYQQLLKVVHD